MTEFASRGGGVKSSRSKGLQSFCCHAELVSASDPCDSLGVTYDRNCGNAKVDRSRGKTGHFSKNQRFLKKQSNKFGMTLGFTLAEVLITLGIIGVVAAIILPMFMENITERRNSERHANIVYKVTQAMEMMKVHGELGRRYDTTEAFVDELQKYLKVSKRCDANHIADCWPTAKVTDGEGNEFEVSKAKTGKNLSLESNTNNVGLILADGASIILNYNPEGGKIDETDPIIAVKKSLPVGGGRGKEFVYTSNVTGSIDFVTDVNGSAAPNAETSNNVYHDIRNLTAARFTKGCAGTELSGIGCVVNVGTSYDPISEEPYTSNNNYWAGAKAKCESMGMTLPDKGTLKNIAAQKASNPNLPQSGYFWSSSESNTYYASGVNFFNGNENNYHKNSPDGVLCVGN